MSLSGRVNKSAVSGPAGSKAPEDLVELGRIAGAYGVHGWVRVRPHSSESSTLLNARHWWLLPPASVSGAGGFSCARPWQVERSRVHSDVIVARLAGVADRTQAETLKGHTVWVPRSNFPKLEPEEYYWVDLVGCRLYGEDAHGNSVLIGQVEALMDNGAHGILRVQRATESPDGQLHFPLDDKGRRLEVLVPFVAAHVHTVDLKNKTLLSNWPADF